MNKSEFVILRVSPEVKKRLTKLAKEKHQKISQFIRDIIDKVI